MWTQFVLTESSPSFPVRDVVLIPGLLPIFLYGCEIKSRSGLGTRLMDRIRGGRTSSKKHMKNYIPFLGMWKVYGDLQRLNKKALVASKFARVQCLEHFCSKGRTSLHCQKVGDMGELTFHAEKTAC